MPGKTPVNCPLKGEKTEKTDTIPQMLHFYPFTKHVGHRSTQIAQIIFFYFELSAACSELGRRMSYRSRFHPVNPASRAVASGKGGSDIFVFHLSIFSGKTCCQSAHIMIFSHHEAV
jgi:hypothetical protein